MPNRLAGAISPYLRSHADNPVDWWQWGSEPFAEASLRQVPVLISIGYSTCHWCHVMARESFSDPVLAAYLNEHFVSIKVDREEHPDVDASYLAAAGAFTEQLGWPLSVFATPDGKAFYAGTYFPPVPTQGLPSFREVLEAIVDAWQDQRDGVEDTAGRLASALAEPREMGEGELPGNAEFAAAVGELQQFEDPQFGGFGGAPKFPVAPLLAFLLDRAHAGDESAAELAHRTLDAMAVSPLRDSVEGGFFRYSTQRDWSEPHYERMLYDNSLLLDVYARASRPEIASGIASFLLNVLRLPSGGFASAQDSESTVDGERVEGGYYLLGATDRARQTAPALDDKVLTGWNGLAIGALASAGRRLGHPDWISAAVAAADLVSTGDLVRVRIGSRVSTAKPTLEDFGMLADGLVDVALATGEVRFAVRALELVNAARAETRFAAPGGGDPVLAEQGLAIADDPSEGAYPSGLSAISRAAVRLALLGADSSLRDAAEATMRPLASIALPRPVSFGATLGVMSLLASPRRQLVVVTDDADAEAARVARAWVGGMSVVVSPPQAAQWAAAGFELFESRGLVDGKPTAYLCDNFVCQLPVTDPAALELALASLVE
jgi:uncharacterized protein